jgi:hypothetical protein
VRIASYLNSHVCQQCAHMLCDGCVLTSDAVALPCRTPTPGKMLNAKLLARVLAIIAMVTAGGCLKTAAVHFQAECDAHLPPEHHRKAPKKFIQYNYDKLLETGSLLDKKRSGRKKKVPPEGSRRSCSFTDGGKFSLVLTTHLKAKFFASAAPFPIPFSAVYSASAHACRCYHSAHPNHQHGEPAILAHRRTCNISSCRDTSNSTCQRGI